VKKKKRVRVDNKIICRVNLSFSILIKPCKNQNIFWIIIAEEDEHEIPYKKLFPPKRR